MTGSIRSAVATLALLVLGVLGCAAPSGFETPEQLAAPGTPLTEAPNTRIGEWTYRLDRVRQDPDGTNVQFVLMNGSSRLVSTVMLRVAVRSLRGDYRSVRVPTGGFRPSERRVVVAHLPPLDFPVEGVSIELLWTTP